MSTRRELYRDPSKGKIAGVCAGIAEYFGMEVWLVRIIMITGFILSSGTFFLVIYIAAWLILDKKPGTGKSAVPSFKKQGKGWHNKPEESHVEVKTKVWQSGEPAKQACHSINKQFTELELKLRKMETYVTSAEFQLNREINNL